MLVSKKCHCGWQALARLRDEMVDGTGVIVVVRCLSVIKSLWLASVGEAA